MVANKDSLTGEIVLPACHFTVFLLLFIFSGMMDAVVAQKPRVDNVNYRIVEGRIEITYDLIAKPEKRYKVSVELKRESVPGFSFKPVNLTGDAGKGYFAGENRRISWDFSGEFKPEEGVEDYYFEITAKKPVKAWPFILGGVLVAGGGTAAYFLLKGGNQDPASKFPVPARP